MAEPLVSIVIPCFNYGRFVLEAIDSCLESTFQDIEILVVDDGSTDPETLSVLAALDRPKTRVIRQENKGLPAARNAGIRAACAPYILPLDADDTLTPTLIEKAFWALETRPDVGFVSFWLQHFGEQSWVWRPDPFNFYQLLFGNSVTVTSLFRKEAWAAAGGYNERMVGGYEDWDFWIALAKQGWVGHRLPEPLFRYRKHGVSLIDAAQKKHPALVAQIRRNHRDLFDPLRLNQLRALWHYDDAPPAPPVSMWRKALGMSPKQLLKKAIQRVAPAPLRGALGRLKIRLRPSAPAVPSIAELPAPCPAPLSVRHYETASRTARGLRALVVLPAMRLNAATRARLEVIRRCGDPRMELTVVTTGLGDYRAEEALAEVTPEVFHLANYFPSEAYYPQALERLVTTRDIDLVVIAESAAALPALPALRSACPRVAIAAWVGRFRADGGHFAWGAAEHEAAIDAFLTECPSHHLTLASRVRIPPHKLHMLAPSVDTDRYRPNPDPPVEALEKLGLYVGKQIVTYLGELSCLAGADRFLRIARALWEADPGERRQFVLLGDGPLAAELRREIERLGEPGTFLLLPPTEDAASLLQVTSLVVAPGFTDGSLQAGLEAMASGVPLVAVRHPGWLQIVEDDRNGLLVEAGDEASFVRRIERLLVSRHDRQRLAAGARHTALEHHGTKAAAERQAELWTRLVETRGASLAEVSP